VQDRGVRWDRADARRGERPHSRRGGAAGCRCQAGRDDRGALWMGLSEMRTVHRFARAPVQGGSTCLMLAADKDQVPTVKLLLARGEHPDAVDRVRRQPCDMAVRVHATPLHAFHTSLQHGRTALHGAAMHGNAATIQALLEVSGLRMRDR